MWQAQNLPNFGSVEHCAVSQLLYHNPRALHIDDTCVDTPLGGPLAGDFNGLWWFLQIYKCLEEKESGLCKGRVIPWKAHQEGKIPESVSPEVDSYY